MTTATHMDSRIIKCGTCGTRLYGKGSPCHTCHAFAMKELSRDWTAQARCREVDPDLWYPEQSVVVNPMVDIICGNCPVKRQCLEAGLHEIHGVWAGYRPADREELRRRVNGLKPEARKAIVEQAAILGRTTFLRITE